jgi:hypothetical protein
MIKQSTFYGLRSDQVFQNEALPYFDIENMIHYLYEAGNEPLNNYVYAAILLVRIVFSKDEERWEESYGEWISNMESRNMTILRVGVRPWADIFHAFYFASPKWNAVEKNENYNKLLRLYMLFGLEENNTFSQNVIEDLTALWEGIPDIDTYVSALTLVTNLEIRNNWNEYPLFYRFLGQSLYVLYRLGYIVHTDYWKIEELTKTNDNLVGMDDVSSEIIREVGHEVGRCICTLEHHPTIRQKDLGYYRSINKYLMFIEQVISCKDSGHEKDGFKIRTKVHDLMAENANRLEEIENDDEFMEEINRNKYNLPVRSLIHLVESRKYKS